jgi:hypothetical protein
MSKDRDTYKIAPLDVNNWTTWSFHMKNLLAKDDLTTRLEDSTASAKNKLVNIKETISDNMLLLLALKGLPESWQTEKAVLMTTSSGTLTCEDVFAKLLAAEKRKTEAHDEEVKASAYIAQHKKGNHKETRACHLCGERGHLMADCNMKKNKGYKGSADKPMAL